VAVTENGTPNWWSLLTSGRYSEVVVNSGLTVHLKIIRRTNFKKDAGLVLQKIRTCFWSPSWVCLKMGGIPTKLSLQGL
jgi:hypothetical protein